MAARYVTISENMIEPRLLVEGYLNANTIAERREAFHLYRVLTESEMSQVAREMGYIALVDLNPRWIETSYCRFYVRLT